MTWGNAEAIVAMTEKIGKREGFGDVLADGVKAAWEKLGQKGTEYAVHIQGEEIPAHDPKFTPGLAMTYYLCATPARHTQGGELNPAPGLELEQLDKYTYSRPCGQSFETGGGDGGLQCRRALHVRLFELSDSVDSGPAFSGHRLEIRHGQHR